MNISMSSLLCLITRDGTSVKGSDWIRLVFAYPFPVNSGAPIASANFISDGKVMATYGVISSLTPMMELSKLMGAPLFKTDGWPQSNSYDGACPTNGGSILQDRRVADYRCLPKADYR